MSFFACGGGSSMGYKLAGAESIGFCDIDERMAGLYRKNMGVDGVTGDIRGLVQDESRMPAHWSSADFVDGSPPCTMFSSIRAGCADALSAEKKFAEGAAKQRLDDLFFWYLDAVASISPRVFVAENVTGMNRHSSRHYLTRIKEKAEAMGYKLRIVQACASRHGAPQLRRRLFFFGTKKTHTALPPPIRRPSTPRQAFADAPNKGEPKKINKAPWFTAGYANTKPGNRIPRGAFTAIVLHPDRTAAALAADRAKGPYHWAEPRYLTYGECSRMQTFPDDYDFGNQCGQYVCGMSVPPFLAQWAGLYVERLLNA